MRDMMKHKGYYGSVHYDDEGRYFYGKLEFIKDLVSYEGTEVNILRKSFEEAIEDYLEICKAQNRSPDKPFKGTFNVRIGPRLHREAVKYALDHNLNLNSLVTEALQKHLLL